MPLRQLAAAIGLALAPNTAEAEEQRFELKLKAQDLASALKDLASEADVQICYDADEPSHGEKTAPALHERYSLRQALDELLGGTELTYEVSPPQGVVTIKQRGSTFPLSALTDTASQIPGYCAYSGFAATKTDILAPAPRRALRPDGPWLRCDRRARRRLRSPCVRIRRSTYGWRSCATNFSRAWRDTRAGAVPSAPTTASARALRSTTG